MSALLVIFIQQWAHSYLRATPKGLSSRTQVHIHTFYKNGLNGWRFATTVTAAPMLIHASLLLFFAGFSVWLVNINHTVGWFVTSWLGLGICGYASVTLLPIFYHDTPYHSPLSPLIWRFTIAVRYVVSRLLLLTSSLRPRRLSFSLRMASLQSALSLPDSIYRSLLWTFESLRKDDELEQFYDAIPNFCASNDESLENFIKPNRIGLTGALVGLMDRTFSSNLVSESVRRQRVVICTETLHATGQHLLGRWYFLRRVLLGEWRGFLESASVGLLVQSWKDITQPILTFYAQCVVSAIIATAPMHNHDEPWIQLVRHHLAVPEATVHRYLAYGQSVLLANLNHMVSRITHWHESGEEMDKSILEPLDVLESMCQFDVQGTLPQLQHEFCNLWNQLVDRARNDIHPGNRAISLRTLKRIHKVFIALHESTGILPLASATKYSEKSAYPDLDNVTSYHACTIEEHNPSQYMSTSRISEITSGAENTTKHSHHSFLTIYHSSSDYRVTLWYRKYR